MIFSSFVILVFGVKCIYPANILYITPVLSPSHHLWNRVLALELVEKGHNITMIGHDLEKVPVKNYSIILLEDVQRKLDKTHTFVEIFAPRPIIWLANLYKYTELICILDLETEGLKTILNYPRDFFDIIIYDATCGQCLYPLIDYFNRPVIAVSPLLLPNFISNAMGNHWYTSYMPHYGVESTNRMSFTERVASFFFTNLDLLIRNYYYMGKYEKMAMDYFGKQVRPFQEYENEFTLLLCNIDQILDFPISLPPNIVPVGGLHVKPSKPLSKEFEKIMTDAKHGVILFSLGTNIRFDTLSKEFPQNIVSAFARLKQTVLWKVESDLVGIELPKNVIVRKWLPQQDILGHPNIKLFISHGGISSTQEAKYHGVPVLGMPFFIDQHNNIGSMVARKQALTISHETLTSDELYAKLIEILNNPIYTNNMRKLSKKFRDQAQTPAERAVFWIEQVLKYGPLDEFTSPTKDMNVFQIYSIDVIAFLLIVTFLFIVQLYLLLKYAFEYKNRGTTKEKAN